MIFNKYHIQEFILRKSNHNGLNHFYQNLVDIRDVLLYDKVPGKFVECIIKGDYKRALSIGDTNNREILSGIPLTQHRNMNWYNVKVDKVNFYSEWIDLVKKSPEYRNVKITKLLKEFEEFE